jgi:polyhydroxybutyrate depolymerase
LVIFLHSEGESGRSVIKNFGNSIEKLADSSDCIVIYPDAVGGHWNANLSSNGKDSVNDAGFVSILIDYFIQVYQANPNHIYLLGFLSGGEMAVKTGCTVPLKLTAIAAFGRPQKNPCNVTTLNTSGFTLTADKKSYIDAIEHAWQFFMSPKNN